MKKKILIIMVGISLSLYASTFYNEQNKIVGTWKVDFAATYEALINKGFNDLFSNFGLNDYSYYLNIALRDEFIKNKEKYIENFKETFSNIKIVILDNFEIILDFDNKTITTKYNFFNNSIHIFTGEEDIKLFTFNKDYSLMYIDLDPKIVPQFMLDTIGFDKIIFKKVIV